MSKAQAGAQRGWWLEDAVPGSVIRHPGGRTINEGEHVWLAWVTHNISDIHGNADAARRSQWGEPLVLGMLTTAIVMGLAAPAAGPAEALGSGMVLAWPSIRLEHHVVAGDTIRAESLIHELAREASESWGRVRRTIRGHDQHGRLVSTIEEELRVPPRPDPDNSTPDSATA